MSNKNLIVNENLTGVILASGNGTRLATISGGVPKQLLKVGKDTLIEKQIVQLREAGISRFIVIVKEGYKDQFEKVLQKSPVTNGIRYEYVVMPKTSDNILHTLYSIREVVETDKIVYTCDVLVDSSLRNAVSEFAAQRDGARIVTTKLENTAGFQRVAVSGSHITNFYPKDKSKNIGGLIDLGFWMCHKDIFPYMEKLLQIDEKRSIFELLTSYVKENSFYHTEIGGWWSDVGNSVEEFKKVQTRCEQADEMAEIAFTVGIPSYKSGSSLIACVKSLQNSQKVGPFEINVVVNDVMDQAIHEQLIGLGANVYLNEKNLGQTGSNNRLFEMTKTPYLIMTQDDVMFHDYTLFELLRALIFDGVDMVAPRYVPLPARTMIEKSLQIGVELAYSITKNWNNGDNYLSSIGRCLGYRTEMVKKFKVPQEVINCDAYYYFENRNLGGNFKQVATAVVNFRTPSNVSEHLKQVRKFVVQKKELEHYLGVDLSKEYSFPKMTLLRNMVKKFVSDPVHTVLYVLVSVYARMQPKSFYDQVTIFWEIDTSTKQL